MIPTRSTSALVASALVASALAVATAEDVAPDLASGWNKEALPIFETYCYDCHGDGLRKGELALDRFGSIKEMRADREVWKRIRDHIRHRLMPPLDEHQPDDAEREKLLAWIDKAVFPVDADHPDPGHVMLRRLNRNEYRNTLRDLLGTRANVIDLLPPDDSGYGFDNIGDVLTLSPAHLERYLEAARVALDDCVVIGPMPPPSKTVVGRDLTGDGSRDEEGCFLFTNGSAETSFKPAHDGRYRIVVTACGTPGGDEAPRMELRLDGNICHAWSVEAAMERPAEHETEIHLEAGRSHKLAVAFTNDFYQEDHPDRGRRDRNLMVNRLRIVGPVDGKPLPKPESHRRIFVARESGESDAAYSTRVLRLFARKAFRRPPHPGEIERHLQLVSLAANEPHAPEEGIRLALEAMLVSPSFLFREEPPARESGGEIVRIDEHALASRLSYFLWSTMPDRRLMELASRGELRARLDAEIDRMLGDNRASELTSNFAGQWLQLRDLAAAQPARRAFPKFDGRLARAMRIETEMLFRHVIDKDLAATTLLDADFTFLNERLARHYGIPGVRGDKFRKVDLPDKRRRGLLGHGSVHLLTSYPLRTSPVLRGKYVLENLLDMAPPPPPPNVPQLEPPSRHGRDLPLREQMVKHREDPACASCHAMMDPIGFAMENFDASGAWRDREHGKKLDVSGEWSDGTRFEGVGGLRETLLRRHKSDFHRALASRLLTYALGRGLDWYDKPAVDAIVRETEESDGSIRAMIRAVVHSVPFQYRRGSS
ncbi:MAG: DUF1592 domain-containing protein [Akkermansiaceae bacterium]|nr:DUF1592 domain-containing protein [Akkermansiaceae bacterium]